MEEFERDINTRAYNAGYRAYEAGQDRDENPHEAGTPEYQSWQRGYDDAYNDEFED